MYYNAKVRIKYINSNMLNTVVLKVWGNIPEQAGQRAEATAAAWDDVYSAETIEVSTREIRMSKFLIKVTLFYKSKPSKPVKVHITAETEAEAEQFADELIQTWKGWKEYSVNEIIKLS
jgi:hypothetical protein